MELNVGKLIGEKYAVNTSLYFLLNDIVENLKKRGTKNFKASSFLYDSRISIADWNGILVNEFLLLFEWATKRIIFSENSRLKPETKVFVFLPYYGITLHFLRRVMPFILLNFKVYIIVSERNEKESRSVIECLEQLFSIHKSIVLNKSGFDKIGKPNNQLMLFTGKAANLATIRKKHKKSKVIGAVGEFSICIFQEWKSLKFKMKTVDPSCTVIKHKFLVDGSKLFDDFNNEYDITIVNTLNPTIIYTDFNLFHFPNYKVINIHDERVDLTGICADPMNGYPGDYRI